MFHIHKWSTWRDVPVLWSPSLLRIRPQVRDGQERRCTKCGELQLRTV